MVVTMLKSNVDSSRHAIVKNNPQLNNNELNLILKTEECMMLLGGWHAKYYVCNCLVRVVTGLSENGKGIEL